MWLQIALPIFTAMAGAAGGFAFGRIGSAMDRRREQREAEAARAPQFSLTWYNGDTYRVTNGGDMAASNIRIDFGNERFEAQNVVGMPDSPTLDSGESFTFLMLATLGIPMPAQARVYCDELPSGQPVAVPTKG